MQQENKWGSCSIGGLGRGGRRPEWWGREPGDWGGDLWAEVSR